MSEKVTLGDSRRLEAVGHGTVVLVMKLHGGKKKRYRLQDVLHVPIIFLVYQKPLSMERLLTSAILVAKL